MRRFDSSRAVGIVGLVWGLAWLSACGGGSSPHPDGGTMDAATGDAQGGGEAGGGDASGGGDAGPASCRVDSECDDGVFCDGTERCMPGDPTADAHGCVAGTPVDCDDGIDCTTDSCSEEMRTCRHTPPDNDGDGHGDATCVDASGNPLGDDCDDNDANRYPGNTEVCDHHDEDCNPDTLGFLDADGDGASSSACCNGTNCGPDCNDSDATIHPGAADGPPSACDNVDNDCSGVADEGCPCVEGLMRPCGTDPELMHIGECRPGQQFCVAGAWTTTCTGDTPPAEEICDGLDNNCDGTTDEGVQRTYHRDADADGFGVVPSGAPGETAMACSPPAGYVADASDCDDSNASVNPGASEVCNGVDDNCNGMVDEGLLHTYYGDADGDGFGDPSTASTPSCFAPAGYVMSGTDCDDTNAAVHPGAADVCNGLDDDCDGTPDEGCTCTDGTTRACGMSSTGTCNMGVQQCVAGAWGDCAGAVDPVAEVCDGLDNDCNGVVDNGVTVPCYLDVDGDGYGTGALVQRCPDPARTGFAGCPTGYSNMAGDCNDSNATVNPGASETCNGADDNCNGTVDEGVETTFYRDADGDFYGDTSMTTTACTPPAGYAVLSGDCNDADATVHPAAPEVCNGVDDNCNGTIDEGVLRTFYADADGDLYGDASTTTTACAPPAGYVETSGDCNDADLSVHPGATEVCNGVDDDCNGTVDDGAEAQCPGADPLAQNVSTWACTSGTCGVATCASPYGDCDGVAANGCEADLSSDGGNCGTCGHSCGVGGVCQSSTCDTVTDVSAGGAVSCATRSSGHVVCWGRGDDGELGDGLYTSSSTPVWVSDLPNISTGGMAVGHAMSNLLSVPQSQMCAYESTPSTNLFCWGQNADGEAGDGTRVSPRGRPEGISGLTWYAPLALGDYHTCGRFRGGVVPFTTPKVHCWGYNGYGQLGIDPSTYPYVTSAAPTGVTDPPTTVNGSDDITAGDYFTCIVLSGGVQCWGREDNGRLGNGVTAGYNYLPQTVALPGSFTATHVESGEDHTCAISTTNMAVCWGSGASGQLGNGTTPTYSATPVTVSGGFAWAQLALGAEHTCGITTGGRLYCWGNNASGQLGIGSTGGTYATPQPVGGGRTWTDIAAGAGHTCALDSTGTVYCWGANGAGQLGDGTTTGRPSPTAVVGL